ncbi:MAG: site-specific DNA-methyltransferase, partial [Thermodesulfovibrionales bacterium]|nr:site-specific DNA-methyltransferase [Thermodesulfovibrionales bacterium]
MHKIINADVYAGLYHLDDASVDVAVTSPPYWGQRDYGFQGQIGAEPTYQEYIGKLLVIFDLLRQKLKDNGVFFLNIGDKYLSKYGKTPLALIPYKLAFFMVQKGWVLSDIIIWYKPNHMPSSIKNRFVNSYEPVFVFSKSNDNIYTENNNFSNILKINLQPTPYRHVAVYPERLVRTLLDMVLLPKDAVVLDPFAGSGTTLKVIVDMNNSVFSKNLSSIMIESNRDYIDIIIKRCNLKIDIIKQELINYNFTPIDDSSFSNLGQKNDSKFDFDKHGFLSISDTKEGYYSLLNGFSNGAIKRGLSKDALCFIGSTEHDIELIYNTSVLNKRGWVIRNMLVIEDKGRWFPIFMVVDDNKAVDYRFDYKKMSIQPKSTVQQNFQDKNFVGYKVLDNLNKVKQKGIVVEVCEYYDNFFPKYVVVKWEDNSFTKEFVVYSQDMIDNMIDIDFNGGCPIVKERAELITLHKVISGYKADDFFIKTNNKQYNGKFKDEKRINRGASPGARASLEEEYFSLQRLYDVRQDIVCDYLNYKRRQKAMSKTDLVKCFP